MRYKLAILFSFFALSGSAQIVKTAGIPYTATTPSHTPSASGSAWAIDTANLDLYAYYGGAWNLAGERIQTISGCAAPAYTPGKGQSVFVINGCDSLYYYRSGAWVIINAGGGGGGGGVSDGDKGDIDVSASGTVWTIDTSAVTNIKVDNNAIDSTKVGDKTLSLSDLNGSWGVQNGSVLKWNGTNWRPGSDNTGADGNGIYSGNGDIVTATAATIPLQSYFKFDWWSGNDALLFDDFGDSTSLYDPTGASAVLLTATKLGLRSTGNIELWGGTGGAKLRMLEPTESGTNYTQIQVGAQSADITYTLPATTGTDGQYLQFTTGGQLQWSTVAAGVTDGDKVDIDVTASGATWTIDTGAVTTGKILDGTILFEDFGQNSASNGQVIKWNGSAWAAAADNTGGAGSTDLSWTGASSPYILNSSSGTDVAFAQGTGITLSTTDSTLTITNSSPDQTVAITGAGISVVTGTYPNFTVTSTEVDGSTTNEIQNLTLSGQSLGISSGTGVTLPVVGVSAGTGISVSSSSGTVTVTNAAPDQTVAITGAGISTVTGTYPNFTITSTEADGSASNEGILGVGAGSGTTATITTNTTTGNAVTIAGGGIVAITETTSSNGGTITITGTEVDGSTTNEIQDLSLSGQTLSLSGDATTVTLPVIAVSAGTGISTSSSGGTVTVTNAAPDQTVAITGAGISAVTGTYPNFTITSTEVDGSTTNEIQNLSLSGQSLGISSGTGVTLPVVGVSAGTGISVSSSSGTVTVTNSAPDQTVSITGAGISAVTGTYPNFTVTSTEVDGSTTNELQTIANTSDATSHTVTLSNSGGSVQLIEGAGISLSTGGSSSAGTVTIAATNSGTVTSVGITAPAAGITVSNSPITSSGNITLALANDLAAVEGLTTAGFAVRTGTSTWATRGFTAANPVAIQNGTGSNNPLIYLNNGDLGDIDITNSNLPSGFRGDVWTIDTGSINSVKIANATILLEDIAANGASAGQIIKYDGSAWVIANESIGGGGVTDGDKEDIDVTGSGTVWTVDTSAISTIKVANDAITFAKMQNSAADGLSVVGRSANSAGDFAEINAGTDGFVLRRSGTTLGFGTVATAGIADNAVNFDKFQDITGNSVLARNAAGDGSVNQVALSSSNLLGRGSTGNISAITLGTNLSMSGSALNTTGHPTISGTPTANTIPKWTSASQLGSSLITDDGTLVAVGGTTGIVVPNGTTLQRPSLPDDNGIVRYNSTTGALEYYKPGGWEAPLLSATGTGLDTAGRVLFADANGRASGADGLFWDAANSRLGINNTEPLASLHIENKFSTGTGIFNDRYGNNPFIVFRRANGTKASPTSVLNGQLLGQFSYRTYVGTEFPSTSAALFLAVATEDHTPTAFGSSFVYKVCPNGSTSSQNVMTINHNGNVCIGTSSTPENKLQIEGSLGRKTPVTVTSTPYAVLSDDTWIIVNRSSSTTITLPSAADWDGREITIKTIQAQTVISGSSNVVPIDSGTAGTAILPATDGAWALLVSNGTNWVIMQRG